MGIEDGWSAEVASARGAIIGMMKYSEEPQEMLYGLFALDWNVVAVPGAHLNF